MWGPAVRRACARGASLSRALGSRAPPSGAAAAAAQASIHRLPYEFPSARYYSTAADGHDDDAAWNAAWGDATAELTTAEMPFEESAGRLRKLLQTELLLHTDLQDRPERFFRAHRALGRHAVPHGPGFFIRFTVQYNLFAGTVLAVGSEDQVAKLHDMQKAGQLGCFGLTEKFAGVQSGLVVNTTAEWDADTDTFVINTPNDGAKKNWISQGFTADKAVVMASLKVGGKDCGPHAFLMDLRHDDGTVAPGVVMDDMGRKTTGNDLDNAWLHFDNVTVPKDALLNRYCDVVDGQYVQKVKGMRPFDMIGQRLYTGRIAVAQAALEYRRALFEVTKRYSDNKMSPSMNGAFALSNIPQLKAIYAEADETGARVDAFVARCEELLIDCIKEERLPSPTLIDAIATCKIRAVETSIDLCFRLKQEVGSFALMDDAGFKHMDFLQCCKFAEGDSRILMQKLARDTMKRLKTDRWEGATEDEVRLSLKLSEDMASEIAASGDKQKAWDDNFRTVYALAEATMDRVEDSVWE